jgi:hypothetical protein
LGQSVPLDERLAIAHWIRQNAPSVGVAMFHYPGESFDANDCDAVLAVPAHPERMIAAVQRALKKAALRSSEGPTDAQT